MASLLISLFFIVEAFDTAQPIACSMWAIAPAYQSVPASFMTGVTYANPFGYANLYSTSSFIYYTFDGYSTGIQWQHFGISEYREDTVSFCTNMAIAQWIHVGVELHDYILTINTDQLTKNQSFYDYGINCTIIPLDKLEILVMQNNIRNFQKDGYIPSETIVALRTQFFEGCTVEYEFHYGDYATQVFRINGYITRYCAVNIDYSPELNTSSAGVNIIWNTLLFQYKLKHHSFLGNTHTFSIVYSLKGFIYTSTDKPLRKQAHKIDIQTCTVDELKQLEIIPENMCQRIVKYRSMFGPVSIHSLYQLGFTTQQIQEIQEYVCNFHELGKSDHDNDEKSNKMVHNKFISSDEKNKKIKKLFQAMITAEIPAYIALSLAEEYQKNGEDSLLRSPLFKSLPLHQQSVVKRVCGVQ
ncbi:MAG: helix-hairpin-helix domain-containing protein [Spirochaetes bacterium]|nr:helix-hairpin-helix domain-containing protein [Spirochaetota bacterium]